MRGCEVQVRLMVGTSTVVFRRGDGPHGRT
jgi:hypothetical protein